MTWWKAVGLAGIAGVVATGVVIVRAERRRQAYTPEQIREQLHVRFAQAAAAEEPAPALPSRWSKVRAGVRKIFRRTKFDTAESARA